MADEETLSAALATGVQEGHTAPTYEDDPTVHLEADGDAWDANGRYVGNIRTKAGAAAIRRRLEDQGGPP